MPSRKQNVIVTGGARGIGFATVRSALQQGFDVVAIDKSFGPEFYEFKTQHADGRLNELSADLTHGPSVREVFDQAALLLGSRVQGAILCAGIYPISESIQADETVWDAAQSVNSRGTFLCAAAAARHMKQSGGGSIVLLSSVAFARGDALEPSAAYAASKGAIVSLTRQLAVEWGGLAIRVNTVVPGVINTALTTIINHEDALEVLLDRLPLRRLGEAEEVAKVSLFLVSDEASYVTGTMIPVDGGYLVS